MADISKIQPFGSSTQYDLLARAWVTARDLKIGYQTKSIDGTANVTYDLVDILKHSTVIGAETSWNQTDIGVYMVASSTAFSGDGNPSTNGGLSPYTYGQLIVSKAANYGIVQFYISHHDSGASNRGIKYRSGWSNTYETNWDTILDSTNYNNYAPTKTGGGASGTWGINITGSSASCTGNAATTTKLATARTINGTSFDGSADITTANWGTARNISISDSDGTNNGTAVSVNGSAAVTLNLPATIKANLNGNADTATKLASTPNNTTVFLRGDNTWSNALTGDLNVSGYFNSVKIKYSPITNATSFATSGIVDMFGVTDNTNGKLAILRTAASAPDALRNNYASGIAWKGSDTYGALTVAYGAPNVKIAGGNGSNPVWWFGLDATSGKTYTLPTDSKILCATDGSNASGTWGISITGNAATATNATNDKDGNQIDTTYTKKSELLDLIYPIGAIYISAIATSPDTLFGGTWEQIGGKFLLSADETHEAGTTGGSETVTLTTAEMPAHTHNGPSHTHTGPSHTHSGPNHTHTLSSHYHWIPAQNGSTSGAGWHVHGSWASRVHTPNAGNKQVQSGSGVRVDWDQSTFGAGDHSHTVWTNAVNSGGPSNNTSGAAGTGATGAAGTGATGASGTGATSSTGSGGAHNNMPPYLTVYMWQRTA